MGNELSQTKVQTLSLEVKFGHVLPPHLKLSHHQLIHIYQNVIALYKEPSDSLATNSLLIPLELSGVRHIDDTLFQQCFDLDRAVSGDLFKAFDIEDDGIVEWRTCLAGLTLCGEGDVQQKCDLILSIFDLNHKTSIGTEELHNVISTSVLAACRICTACGNSTNEIHANPGAIAHDVLDEIQHADKNKNGSIPIGSLSEHLQHSQALQQALCDLGLLGNHINSAGNHLMASPHTQSSPQHLKPTQSLSNASTNGLHHTWVWTNLFPSHPRMPCSRSRHAACHHDNQIYIHGGRNGTSTLKDFWKYDTISNVWTQMLCGGDIPPPLQEHTMVAHNDMLYMFGGEFGFRDANEIPLWIFDINKKSWRQLEIISEVKTPCSRRGHTTVVHQDALHVFGGYIDLKGAINEFWTLDFMSCWWHLNPDNLCNEVPTARHLHSAVVYDNAMWVYGGLNNLVALKDLWKWDFGSRLWSKVKFWSGPPSLYGHSAITTHNSMLIFGGQNADGVIRNDLWKFHFGSQNWQKIVSHKGLIPPPSTRNILLSMFSTSYLESPIAEEPRPRSAPHPSRQRKVTPLRQVLQQLQDSEPRPHSSPPFIVQDNELNRLQRRHFKNRVHPSASAAAAEAKNEDENPDSATFDESHINVSDQIPLISAEQTPSAIDSAVTPKRLFAHSKWTADHSKRVLFDKYNRPIDAETEVISNRFASDVLIVEDISDMTSLSSFNDGGECQPCIEQCQEVEECQPEVEQCVHPHKCNISASPSADNDNMPPISIETLVVPHDQTVPNISHSTNVNPFNQMLSTNPKSQSAMIDPMYNNLDLPIGKSSISVIPDKNLNYMTMPVYENNLSPTEDDLKLKTGVEPKAEVKSMHSHKENLCAEQNVCARNKQYILDQNSDEQTTLDQTLLMHNQNKEIHQNMQGTRTNSDEQMTLVMPKDNFGELQYQTKQGESSMKPQYSKRTNITVSDHHLRNYNRPKGSIESAGSVRGNGAMRPKLHGRSQTEQALPLDRQGGGAVGWNQRGGQWNSAYDPDKDEYSAQLSPCLILLGGQESLSSNLQYFSNPISMWKCHIVPGKPSKKEIQQLLSQ